jgi:hypothetical protein
VGGFKSLGDSFLTQFYSNMSKAFTIHPHMLRRQETEPRRNKGPQGERRNFSLSEVRGLPHTTAGAMWRQSHCHLVSPTQQGGDNSTWDVHTLQFSPKVFLNAKPPATQNGLCGAIMVHINFFESHLLENSKPAMPNQKDKAVK